MLISFLVYFLQPFVKLRKDLVTFSPHMLASLAVMLFVLVTNIDNTTEEVQKNKIFETFEGEKNKKMLICHMLSGAYHLPNCMAGPACPQMQRVRQKESCA